MPEANQNEFLQSAEWMKFQQKLGHEVFSFKKENVGSKIIKQDFFSGKSFLFVPRGPFGEINLLNLKQWLEELSKIGKKEKAVFAHIEPPWPAGHPNNKILEESGCKKSPKQIEPQSTYILDISAPAEELFKALSRGMRYNIKYSQREGLVPETREDKEAINDFIKIFRQTRDNLKFKPYSEEYYELMGRELLGNIAKIINIKKDGQVVSSTIFIFFNNRATALHTFGLEQCKKLKCLSFALWSGILEAKRLGYKEFDFWGSEDYAAGLQGSGQLKKYFGAQKRHYGRPMDCIIDKKYYFLWRILKKTGLF